MTVERFRRIRCREWLPAGDVAVLAALLTTLVIGVAPVVVLLTGVHAMVALGAVLVGYAVAVLAADEVVAGVVAAIPVTATVNADLPVLRGPGRTVDLQVVVADGAVLAGLALLVASGVATLGRPAGSVPRRTSPVTGRPAVDGVRLLSWPGVVGWPGTLLAAFAGWALLGSAFAAHDPTTAAVFGVMQVRYVGYFAVAAGLVATGLVTIRELSVALAVAVVGHSVFALAQFAHGEPLGLAYLGETIHENELPLGVLGIDQYRGRYLGGLVGNNAAYATVAVPAVAILAWIVDRATGRLRYLGLAGIALVGTLCLPLTQYDSVRIAFATVLLGSLALSTLPGWPGPARAFVERDRRRALAAVLAVGTAGLVAVFSVGAVAVFDVLPVVSAKNLGPRLDDYANAVAVALRHPLFGYGGGNVEPVATEIGFSDDIAIHSIFFSYLAETGVVGAGLWTAAVVSTGVLAVRLAWARGDQDLVGYLCVGALGVLAIAMVDQVWDNHTTLGTFWTFAGAIVGAYSVDVGG